MYFKYPCLNTELHSVFTNFFQRITVIIICSEHEMHFKHSRMSIWFMIICDVSLHCLFFMAVFDCWFWSLVLTNSAVLQCFTSIIIFLHWSLWCKYTSCLHCASVCGKNTCISNGNFFFFFNVHVSTFKLCRRCICIIIRHILHTHLLCIYPTCIADFHDCELRKYQKSVCCRK